MMEEHFRRALMLSRGDFSTFVTRPISGAILGITAVLLVWGTVKALRKRSNRPDGTPVLPELEQAAGE